MHTQLEDGAPQHPAARELPARGTLREGVGLCTKPLPCDNRSGNFTAGLFIRSLLSSSYSLPDKMCSTSIETVTFIASPAHKKLFPTTHQGGKVGIPMFREYGSRLFTVLQAFPAPAEAVLGQYQGGREIRVSQEVPQPP